jgi:hypothetical protein
MKRYRVTFPGHDCSTEVEAEDYKLAAEDAAEEAFNNWAWELPDKAFPIDVVVEDDQSVYTVKVDLDFDPVFFVTESKMERKETEEEDEEEPINWI